MHFIDPICPHRPDLIVLHKILPSRPWQKYRVQKERHHKNGLVLFRFIAMENWGNSASWKKERGPMSIWIRPNFSRGYWLSGLEEFFYSTTILLAFLPPQQRILISLRILEKFRKNLGFFSWGIGLLLLRGSNG